MRPDRPNFAWALVGVALLTWSGQGLAQEPPPAEPGPGERAGNALDAAGRRLKRGLEGAEAAVQKGWDRTKAAVNNMGVESRVYGRLHWDKALTDAPIQLETQPGGVIVLRGTVPDAAAKAKAETLAGETVGVAKVVNQLAVGPVEATTTTTTTTKSTTTTTPRRPARGE